MKKNNKGFTLAELLIVVAIIAVLTAIAIPVFSGNLEKAKEGADAANLRAAYAMAAAASLDNDGQNVLIENITLKQSGKFEKLNKTGEKVMIGDYELTDANNFGDAAAVTSYCLGFKAENGHVSIATQASASAVSTALGGTPVVSQFTAAG